MEGIRLMIIGDNQIFKEGLGKLLGSDPAIKVAGVKAKKHESLREIKQFQPDVIVFHIYFTTLEIPQLLTSILKTRPQIKILVVGQGLNSYYVNKLERLDINGFLTEDISGKRLITIIHGVYQGKFLFENRLMKINPNRRQKRNGERDKSFVKEKVLLSKREQEILRLVLNGHNSRQIAGKLSISIRTVQNHRAHIMKKLKVKNSVEMIKYVYRHDIITP